MAKIIFGNGVTGIRGKAGGMVYSANAFGAVLKTKSNPKTNKTNAAYAAKSKFLYLGQYWSATLTQLERDSWDAAKVNFPQTDAFGNTILLTGFDLFQKFNGNLLLIEEPLITLPPAPVVVNPNTAIIVTANLAMEELNREIQPNPIPANLKTVLNVTSPYPQGVTNFSNRLRFGQHTLIGGGININVYAVYIQRFGQLIAGQKIGYLGYNVDITSGIESGRITGNVTINNYLYRALRLSGAVGTFQLDDVITGSLSGTTATVDKQVAPGAINYKDFSGSFQIGDVITGSISGATGTVDRVPYLIRFMSTPLLFYMSPPYGQATVLVNNTTAQTSPIWLTDQVSYAMILVDVGWGFGDVIFQATEGKISSITYFQFL